MAVYCFVLSCFCVYLFLQYAGYRLNSSFLVVLLAVISGFRYMVGIDYPHYVDGYIYPDSILYEPIWYQLNDGLKSLGLSYQAFFLTTSIAIVSITHYAIKKYDCDKRYILIALFLFFATNLYIESMNLVRQYAAMSVTFLAFAYRLDKSFLKYILLMVLAVSMHSSAIICLVVYELCLIKYPKLLLLGALVVSLVCGELLIGYFLDFLIGHVDSTFTYFSYLSNKSYLVTSSGLYKIILNLLAVFFIITRRSYYSNDLKYSSIYNLVLVSIILYNIFLYFDVGIRLSKYFYYFIIVLYPYHLRNCREREFIINSIFIVVLLSFTLMDVSGSQYTPFLFNFELF